MAGSDDWISRLRGSRQTPDSRQTLSAEEEALATRRYVDAAGAYWDLLREEALRLVWIFNATAGHEAVEVRGTAECVVLEHRRSGEIIEFGVELIARGVLFVTTSVRGQPSQPPHEYPIALQAGGRVIPDGLPSGAKDAARVLLERWLQVVAKV